MSSEGAILRVSDHPRSALSPQMCESRASLLLCALRLLRRLGLLLPLWLLFLFASLCVSGNDGYGKQEQTCYS